VRDSFLRARRARRWRSTLRPRQARAWGNYVGGEWIGATGGETFDVINPATEEVVGSVPKMTREDAQRAIATARETFDSGVWSGLAPDERSRILLQVVEKFTENEDELAALETQQAGMTIRATSTVVIGYCINHWDYFARAADRQMQEPLEPVSFPTHSYNSVLPRADRASRLAPGPSQYRSL